MTSEGNGWFVCTVPAISAYVMFHPTSGSAQEPGSGEQGYPVAGEAWIQNKTVTFSSKVITSHIDVATGKKIADDVIDNQAKTTSASSYTTSALSGRTDVITPSNAQGKYSAGIVNVVYLYTSSQPITTAPPATTQPATTVPAGSYYNASYLETYANSAYNEKGLGSVYSKGSTTWKTWSPEATDVKVKLYKTGSDSESGAGVIGTYPLTKNSTTGVWSTTLTGDYKDVYYTYLVTVNGSTN